MINQKQGQYSLKKAGKPHFSRYSLRETQAKLIFGLTVSSSDFSIRSIACSVVQRSLINRRALADSSCASAGFVRIRSTAAAISSLFRLTSKPL